LLAHERGGDRRSHGVEPRPGTDGWHYVHHRLPESAEFDELVVGRWIHLEQMDTGTWWANIGGVTLWIRADRDGRPTSVSVYGPGDYGDPVAGCRYDCTWSAEPMAEVADG
jgi:hypothetical protein